MTWPTTTEITAAADALEAAFLAFPIMASLLAVVVLVKGAPIILKLVRRAFPG